MFAYARPRGFDCQHSGSADPACAECRELPQPTKPISTPARELPDPQLVEGRVGVARVEAVAPDASRYQRDRHGVVERQPGGGVDDVVVDSRPPAGWGWGGCRVQS